MPEENYAELLQAAETGNAEAMGKVAHRLYEGNGVERDQFEAYKWYYKAAQAGNLKAMYVYSCLISTGLDKDGEERDKDEEKADIFDWCLKAAQGGYLPAIAKAAELYAIGEGTEKNKKKAMELLSKLPRDEAGRAMNTIAFECSTGPEAVEWYTRSAEYGNAQSMLKLSTIYATGHIHVRCYQGEDGATQDSNLALTWAQKSARAGNYMALMRLANYYYIGDNAAQSYEEAFREYERANRAGVQSAMMQLGRMYYLGRGTKKNLRKAFGQLQLAEECLPMTGLPLTYLGQMYETGEGITQDCSKAKRCYEAAIKNDTTGMAVYRLAQLYFYGRGVVQDAAKALELFTQAAENRNIDKSYRILAARKVAKMYELGEGIPADPAKAKEWQDKVS